VGKNCGLLAQLESGLLAQFGTGVQYGGKIAGCWINLKGLPQKGIVWFQKISIPHPQKGFFI